jgi:hypothetical protein
MTREQLARLDSLVIEARETLLNAEVEGTGTPESEERIAVEVRKAQEALAAATAEILRQLREESGQ